MISEVTKPKIDPLAKILAAVTVVLAALILLELAGWRIMTANADMRMSPAIDPNEEQPQDVAPFVVHSRSLAEALKAKNLFVLKPPKENPVKEILGILGNEALINGKWYKAGDRVGDARVVAIDPTQVRILWDGREKAFSPIGATGSGASGPGAAARRAGPRPPGGRVMSPEEHAGPRERWKTMSPAERQTFRDEMRERVKARGR
jgi:hypothetical protein